MIDEYRYTLERPRSGQERWLLGAGTLLWLCMNPSVAVEGEDETRRAIAEGRDPDDQSTKKMIGFTRRWSFARMVLVNLWAYRATKPADLWAAHARGVDIVGPVNDATLITEAKNATAVVCAWGRIWREPAAERVGHVLNLLWQNTGHKELFCIGRNGDGSPTHPVMAPYVDRPSTWKIRKEAA